MPLSDAARRAVLVATAHSPVQAQRLLDLLRTAPETVKRKPGRYGPLGIVIGDGSPLSVEDGRLCERFSLEWLLGEFGVNELADALEAALREVTGRAPDPRRYPANGWRTLAGRRRESSSLLGRPEQ